MSSKSETPLGPPERLLLEYIWLDGKNNFRSKIRVINSVITSIKDIPIWNYDGSSTYQASSEDSEITLFPCAAYKNPLNPGFLVLCSTYDIHGEPLVNNHRHAATRVFAEEKEQIFRKRLINKIGIKEYKKKYGEYTHLFYKKSFFRSLAKNNNLKIKIFNQSFRSYENSKYRYNIIFQN